MSSVAALESELVPSPLSEAVILGAQIAELCAYIDVAKAHLLELIREFDEKEYWATLGFPSCISWLGFQCRIGANAAREHLRVARALVQLPKISRKFSEGGPNRVS